MSAKSFYYESGAEAQSFRYIRESKLGVHHANNTEPQNPRPNEPVVLHITVGPQILADDVYIIYCTDGDPVVYTFTVEDGNNFCSCVKGTLIEAKLSDVSWNASTSWGYLLHFRAALPSFPEGTRVSYLVFAWSETEQRAYFADTADRNHDNVERFEGYSADFKDFAQYERKAVTEAGTATRFVYHVDNAATPAWAHEAIFYQVFLDRFHPGPGRKFAEYGEGTERQFTDPLGGTLAGLHEALSYLEELGVTALWLSPCFPSKTHHGYDVSDYRAVNPRLGTMKEMKDLVQEIHSRGMRVILDFVPNHSSNEMAFFQHAVRFEDSPYRDWFYFMEWPREYEAFFGVPSLPKINTNCAAAREYLIESATFWLEEVGIDGFRMDHAQGTATTFWSDYRAAIKNGWPEALTIGEITESSPFLSQYQGRLDGVLDFVWVNEARRFFVLDKIDAPSFEHFLKGHDLFFPDKDFLLPTFLDNHDMNRFLWSAKGDVRRLKMAAICQFTQAAPPIIYYGTEVGVSQDGDVHQGDRDAHEMSRTLMLWGEEQNKELLGFYKRLIHFRRRHAAAYKGGRVPLLVAPGGLLVYARQYQGETVIALFNNSDSDKGDLRVPLRKLKGGFAGFRNLAGDWVTVDKQEIRLSLPARGAELLWAN